MKDYIHAIYYIVYYKGPNTKNIGSLKEAKEYPDICLVDFGKKMKRLVNRYWNENEKAYKNHFN